MVGFRKNSLLHQFNGAFHGQVFNGFPVAGVNGDRRDFLGLGLKDKGEFGIIQHPARGCLEFLQVVVSNGEIDGGNALQGFVNAEYLHQGIFGDYHGTGTVYEILG